VTTKLPDEPYPSLLAAVGGNGYPTIVFLDGEGKVLGEQLGDRTVPRFGATLAKIRRLAKLTKKEPVEAFVLKCDLGLYDLVDAEAAAKGLGKLGEKDAARVKGTLATVEYFHHLSTPPESRAEIGIAGKAFAEMAKEGRIPSDATVHERFWGFQIFYAQDAEDADAFERALPPIEKLWKGDAKKLKRLAQLRRQLEIMKLKASGELDR
jgi:hypothetical protein